MDAAEKTLLPTNFGGTAPLVAGLGIAALGVVLFAWFATWSGLKILVQPQTVGNILAPLLLTSAFIERAVEVFITPWRDPGYNRLNANLTATQADPAKSPKEKADANDRLNAYVAVTTRYAFALAVMFGLVAAMVGVRALWPFLDPQALAASSNVSVGQVNTFVVFDVVLSAALMAGGANGIHSMVTLITTFCDTTTQKAQNSVNSPPPGSGNPQATQGAVNQ
ncbi:MAG: hypothetical protein ACRD3N_16055 [Terracidiphilus sp.]